jgi:hypothetical protein
MLLMGTTMGLVIASVPTALEHSESSWPWLRTELVLLLSLPVSITCYAARLTWAQRRLMKRWATSGPTSRPNAVDAPEVLANELGEEVYVHGLDTPWTRA